MEQADTILTERCVNLGTQAERARAWIVDNRETVRGEFDGLDTELRRAKRFFTRCERAARRKMCVGVFGPSQAGKSYLISALARDKDGTLLTDFGGETHDFIGEINPEGGKESTGLVTRFTMTKPASLPEGFPVQILLLSELDLVKVLANTYYADCEHREDPDLKRINARLDALEKLSGSGSGVSLDGLEELQEYLKHDFQAKPRVQELNRSYWNRALRLGPTLNLEGRIQLYSLIWDEIEEFTGLLRLLATALESLEYPDMAYAPVSALIPREASIIDVALLRGLGNADTGGILEIANASGKRVSLPRAVVTALTAELTIVMQNKPDDYFEHTDLLDFPGYRSRYKFDDVRRELQKPGMITELFLRGKVAYLFQRYSTERELTSMLLCIGPSNQEVQDLPGVINNWIEVTHGQKPESRKDKPVALFFVLSKFDMEFEQKKGAPSVESRWDNRLHASLLGFFGKQYDWPANWNGVTPFNNMFLLRNPNFRFDAVLDINAEGLEQGVRPEQLALVEALEKAFMNSALVKNHFENPQESWQAAMRLNDGGISLIRERLRPLCNPTIKRQQIATSIAEQIEKLHSRLKAFWQSDDREETRRQKTLLAAHLLRDIFAKMADPSYLGEFVGMLQVTDQTLYDLYFDARAGMTQSGQTPAERIVGSGVDLGDLMSDFFDADILAPSIETEEADNGGEHFTDEAAYFASVIEGHWLATMHQHADNPALQQRYGFAAGEFTEFINELALGSVRLGIRPAMEKTLRKASAYANVESERLVWKQASLAAGIINAYVDFLGFNPRVLTDDERTIQGKKRSLVLFASAPPVGAYPALSPGRTASSPWKNDWLRAVARCIADNVDFDGKTVINSEQNTLLGGILRHFEAGRTA